MRCSVLSDDIQDPSVLSLSNGVGWAIFRRFEAVALITDVSSFIDSMFWRFVAAAEDLVSDLMSVSLSTTVFGGRPRFFGLVFEADVDVVFFCRAAGFLHKTEGNNLEKFIGFLCWWCALRLLETTQPICPYFFFFNGLLSSSDKVNVSSKLITLLFNFVGFGLTSSSSSSLSDIIIVDLLTAAALFGRPLVAILEID